MCLSGFSIKNVHLYRGARENDFAAWVARFLICENLVTAEHGAAIMQDMDGLMAALAASRGFKTNEVALDRRAILLPDR
jgi:hypothetical protein